MALLSHISGVDDQMEKPGVKNMGLGALWFVGGSAFTALAYMYANAQGGGRYVVAGGAIVVGALQLIVGAVQFLRFSFQHPVDRTFPDKTIPFRVLLAALVGVTRTPAAPSEKEREAINTIFKQIAGTTISVYSMQDMAKALDTAKTGAADYLLVKSNLLSTPIKELIISGSLLVIMAEGPPPNWEQTLFRLGSTMGLTRTQVRGLFP